MDVHSVALCSLQLVSAIFMHAAHDKFKSK